MKTRYYLRQLSQREQEFHEMVLLEELDMQTWYSVSCSALMGEELCIALQ